MKNLDNFIVLVRRIQMKTFDVYAIHNSFYIVKANTEQDAIDLVKNGNVESVDVETEIVQVNPLESS